MYCGSNVEDNFYVEKDPAAKENLRFFYSFVLSVSVISEVFITILVFSLRYQLWLITKFY